MSTPNPLDELKSADGVSLHDLCPPVFGVTDHEIPGITQKDELCITKKRYGNNSPSHATEFYCGGFRLNQLFQSRAMAAAHVADRARAVADQKTREAIEAAMKEGGAA